MLVHLSPNCVSTEGSQSATGVTAAPNEFLCVYFVIRTPLHVAHIHMTHFLVLEDLASAAERHLL